MNKLENITTGEGKFPLASSNFLLRVDAIYDLPCKKISSIQQENEYETIQSGGENNYVYLREKPVSKPYTFQIERYVGEDYFDPLPVGRQPSLPIVLYISRYAGEFKDVKRTFTFSGCTVMSKTYGELDAEKGGLMTETTQIAFQRMEVVDKMYEEVAPAWGFDTSGKKMVGVGKRKAAYNRDEIRKRDMERQSRIWPKTRSARSIQNVLK